MDDRTARAKAFIKTPVTHDADACFDANDEVICFAETDNSACPSDRRVTRAINCLEEIAQALNARPEHSRLEAENKRLREGLQVNRNWWANESRISDDRHTRNNAKRYCEHIDNILNGDIEREEVEKK